jgi:hypothetical protein
MDSLPQHKHTPLMTCFREIALVIGACAGLPGCLLNAVNPITHDRAPHPDSNHSIVVIGVGLDATWPYKEISVVLDEYSLKKQDLTGNCFLYNRIEATRPPHPSPVHYFVFEVPASAYTYGGGNVNAQLPPSPNASGFIAAAGKTVYFADYVFVGNQSVEQRRNLEAARGATQRLLPRGAFLEEAQAVSPPRGHMFLCTP